MTDIVVSFFTDIAKRGYEPLLHSVSGSIRWDMEEDSWYVIMTNGKLQVSKNRQDADTICKVNKEDFEHMVLGTQNPLTLFLQMKMQCQGTLGLLYMFQRLFPDDTVISLQTKGEKYE
jgi:predicted lipid carrier protein YhbT